MSTFRTQRHHRPRGRWLLVGSTAVVVGTALACRLVWSTQAFPRPEVWPTSTYYESTRTDQHTPPLRPAPHEDTDVDVCVVGGGLAGLATALGLVERGRSVVVVEQRRVGWGASGTNAGFALPGFGVDEERLLRRYGATTARAMYDLSVEALALLRKRISEWNLDCDVEDLGCLQVSCYAKGQDAAEASVARINNTLGTSLEVWSQKHVHEVLHTPTYYHGIFEASAFAVNPLKLVLGLAHVAERKGVRIYEGTDATRLTPAPLESKARRWHVAVTGSGRSHTITADDVVLAGSAHLPATLNRRVARSVAPLYTYIVVTEPLDEKLPRLMAYDDHFALNYFRPLPDGRLLWGGLASGRGLRSAHVEAALRRHLTHAFPSLRGVKVEYVWGGTLGLGPHEMPLLGQRDPGVWYCSGFGGHGLGVTTMAGELVASGIASGGQDTRWKLFQDKVPLGYAGYPFDAVGVQLVCWLFALVDQWRALWPSRR